MSLPQSRIVSGYGGGFDANEGSLEKEWNGVKGQSRLTWEQARRASRAAWDRIERAMSGDFDKQPE